MISSQQIADRQGPEAVADPLTTACARLGISRSLAYIEINAGRLRAIKARTKTLITRADQAAWLDQLPAIKSRAVA